MKKNTIKKLKIKTSTQLFPIEDPAPCTALVY